LLLAVCASALAADKPNIVFIWGDDIGQSNLSTYTDGLMGYRTPNIDRIANEGMKFTDYYAEQSCTAGRAAFITGQSVFRTGLSKVGMPGAKQGISLLKNHGYATGQFGKNHLGDRNEYLPTVHGFDVFYGNLYHLNAEEEPVERDYPKNPEFFKKYGPRGVLDCKASDKDDPTVDPRFGRVGKQVCKDTGPLHPKRMETIDDDIAQRANEFMKESVEAGKPVFLWITFTHMHLWTHTKPESLGQSGRWQSKYHDTMIDHDKNVGSILDMIDKLGIADNTIVMYGTDNGPHMNTWPDGGMTPFLGGRLPHAGHGALAGQDQGRYGIERNYVPSRLDADPAGRRRRARYQGKAPERAQISWQELQGASRRLQLPAPPHGQGRERPPYRVLLLFGRR
jgi:arylsulfatase